LLHIAVLAAGRALKAAWFRGLFIEADEVRLVSRLFTKEWPMPDN
jgi:hypothetical protein